MINNYYSKNQNSNLHATSEIVDHGITRKRLVAHSSTIACIKILCQTYTTFNIQRNLTHCRTLPSKHYQRKKKLQYNIGDEDNALQNIKTAQVHKFYVNHDHKPREFHVLQYVFLGVRKDSQTLKMGPWAKLSTRYCGPYTITKQIGLNS